MNNPNESMLSYEDHDGWTEGKIKEPKILSYRIYGSSIPNGFIDLAAQNFRVDKQGGLAVFDASGIAGGFAAGSWSHWLLLKDGKPALKPKG